MHLARSLALAATTLVMVSQTSVAWAQSSEPPPTGKGIVGGTLLGAEAVLLTEAALDVSPEWLYYVGGAAGAVGGGIAGYFLEDSLGSKGSMYLLAGGMLLVIPTTVAVLSATAYEQTAEYTQDQAPKDEPTADPIVPASPTKGGVTSPTPATNEGQPATPGDVGAPSSTTAPATAIPPGTTPPPAPAPTSRNLKHRHRGVLPPPALVGVDTQNRIHWGIPAVEVRETYSRAEVARFGLQQRHELRIPLLRLVF